MNARDTKHEARCTRHEARILVMAMMAICSASLLAMPTEQELEKVQPMVAELMAPTMDDFKAKKKTAAEVADMAVKYAGEAETEAAKFMLYRSSIPYYVRGEAYDKAADAVKQMKTNVKGVPAKVVAEIISKATVRANKEKAPRLFELYQQAKTQATAEKDVEELRKKPASTTNKRKLAEALAMTGEWQEALKEFAKLKDGAAQIAKKELDGSAKSIELGEFWWAYKPNCENADDAFKIHAAVHYRKALAAGEITGLKKNIVEQRIAKYAAVESLAGGQGTGPRTPAANGLYCVIDLSGGPDAKKYPVSYLNDMPKDGWSDEYKTTKLVLRRIEPGAFMMGKAGESRRVEIKNPFYIGVFEVSQKQWSLVMGDRPAFWKGPQWFLRPVEQVPYERLRGKDAGSKWPESDEVDAGSFMGVVRQKTGLRFDLPTEAQWEYACRAGTETDFYNNTDNVDWRRDSSLDKIGRYRHNGGWNEEKWGKFKWGKAWTAPDRNCETNKGTAAIGSYQPNTWGLYDMLGNVNEWCLDYQEKSKNDSRVIRGGHWCEDAYVSTTHWRGGMKPNQGNFDHGFRLCLPLAGGAAASAPVTKSAPVAKVGKAWQEKGNEATLDLGEKYGKMEFVKCPAGRVDMVVSSGGETCKVNISRPFWIMKKPLTRKHGHYRQGVADKDEYPFWRREQIESVIDRISADFKSEFPAGYVMRLPTLAEWEYAFHANTHDRKNPYYDLTKNHRDDEFGKKIYDVPGSINPKVANDWGLTDYNWEKVLDKFTVGELKAFNGGFDPINKPGNVSTIPKPSDKTDPLYWTEDEPNQIYISRMPDWVLWRCRMPAGTKDAGNDNTHARLVIGPDLVSEWKAKNGKK